MSESAAPTIIDLFSGCGGFGLGAELAGFHTSVPVDIDPDLQASYGLNFPHTKVLEGDVAGMTAEKWAFSLGMLRPDGVIGGPPCQGFSRIGKRRKDDPRNTLVAHFFRQVTLLDPKFFVMENVEGLLDEANADILQKGLALLDAKYTVLRPMVIKASDYGAATTRRRVVVIGYDPVRMGRLNPEDFQPDGIGATTVREAIGDLPGPMDQQAGDYSWSAYPTGGNTEGRLSDYARSMRALPPSGLGWKRAIENLAAGKVSGLASTIHTDAVAQRFRATDEGRVEPVSRYPRLSWDGQCPTLRAGTGKDKGSFQSMRPIHPSEPRVITVREAARLQGFPDWFCFSPAKWHSFRMIGNSVSPVVAKHLLGTIKHRLYSAVPQRPAEASGG